MRHADGHAMVPRRARQVRKERHGNADRCNGDVRSRLVAGFAVAVSAAAAPDLRVCPQIECNPDVSAKKKPWRLSARAFSCCWIGGEGGSRSFRPGMIRAYASERRRSMAIRAAKLWPGQNCVERLCISAGIRPVRPEFRRSPRDRASPAPSPRCPARRARPSRTSSRACRGR